MQQGIRGFERVDVKHQPIAVVADRRQDKNLWLDLVFQFHHQTHNPWLEASGAQQADIRIVGQNLAGEAFQHGGELDAFEIDNQPLRILDREVAEFQRLTMLDGDPCVIGRRPDAHRQNARQLRGRRPPDRADQQE